MYIHSSKSDIIISVKLWVFRIIKTVLTAEQCANLCKNISLPLLLCFEVMIFPWILTVETCDERNIPAVDHATYKIHRFMSENATTTPPSLRQNFSVPGYVNVTYTCDLGYRLQDHNNNVIGCAYVKTPRRYSNGSIHFTVVAEAVWTSSEGIICEKGNEMLILTHPFIIWIWIEKSNWNIDPLRKQLCTPL